MRIFPAILILLSLFVKLKAAEKCFLPLFIRFFKFQVTTSLWSSSKARAFSVHMSKNIVVLSQVENKFLKSMLVTDLVIRRMLTSQSKISGKSFVITAVTVEKVSFFFLKT